MDFDLFGPGPGSPSAQPQLQVLSLGVLVRQPECLWVEVFHAWSTCSASSPAYAHFGADQLQQLMLQMLNNQNSVAATADELSDASSECSVDSFEPSFWTRKKPDEKATKLGARCQQTLLLLQVVQEQRRLLGRL